MRAVVDANVWASALMATHSAPARALDAARQGHFTVVCSRPVLSELETILRRPRIARRCGLIPTDVPAVVAYLRSLAIMVTVTGAYSLCRDPDDDKLIETAIRGQAPITVSRDPDLHDPALGEPLAAHRIRVVTPQDFLVVLRADR